MKLTFTKIGVNGREQQGILDIPDDGDAATLKAVQALCREYFGDNDFEHVRVFWAGEYTSMFVDETGRIKNLPMNTKATKIYRNNVMVHDPDHYAPASMPWIAGPAILFGKNVWR